MEKERIDKEKPTEYGDKVEQGQTGNHENAGSGTHHFRLHRSPVGVGHRVASESVRSRSGG